MTGPDETALDRFVQGSEEARCELEIHVWWHASFNLVHQVIVRAAHLVLRDADQEKDISRLLEVHCHALSHIRYAAESTDQKRGRDRDVPAGGVEFIVQAVFAADERSAVSDGNITASFCGPNERTKDL